MSQPKMHHFVPRTYLEYFAKKYKNEYRLLAIDKVKNRSFEINVKDAAKINSYNKIEKGRFIKNPPDGNVLHYEEKYNQLIEGKIPQIIQSISGVCTLCNEDKPILTQKLKRELAMMLIVQLLRTPLSRNFTAKIGYPICKDVIDKIGTVVDKFGDENKRQEFKNVIEDFSYTEEFVKSMHLKITTDERRIERFCDFLLENRIWIIYRNNISDEIPFVTSDNPVVMLNSTNEKLGISSGNGIDKPSTVIYMPLTPKYMLALYHKRHLIFRNMECFADQCISVDKKFVEAMNEVQKIQCYKQVYTKPLR